MMRKQLLFLTTVLCLSFSATASVVSGSLATNFTLTDINGITYDLEDLTNQGKSVILNFSSTWSPASWAYDKREILNSVNAEFGAQGSNDVIILYIETDPNTNLSCLRGGGDCNSSSMGDWTSLVDYPIIDLGPDDLWLEEAYKVDQYPTLYGISSDRIVTNFGQVEKAVWSSWLFEGNKFQADINTKAETKQVVHKFDFLSLIQTSDTEIKALAAMESIAFVPTKTLNVVSQSTIEVPTLSVDQMAFDVAMVVDALEKEEVQSKRLFAGFFRR